MIYQYQLTRIQSLVTFCSSRINTNVAVKTWCSSFQLFGKKKKVRFTLTAPKIGHLFQKIPFSYRIQNNIIPTTKISTSTPTIKKIRLHYGGLDSLVRIQSMASSGSFATKTGRLRSAVVIFIEFN